MSHYVCYMTEDERDVTKWFSHTDLWSDANLSSLQGQTNRNYRLVLSGKEFHLKVRQHTEFPSFEKLQYINGLLASHGVSYAPIVETVVQHKRFPQGAILFEWIEGRSIATLSEYEEFLPKIIATLKAIHAIQAPYFENKDLGIQATSYTDFITAVLRSHAERCKEERLLDTDRATRLVSFLSAIRCGRDVSPVLVHRDATKSNILLPLGGDPLLIDWDNAEFTAPLAEVARIIFAYRWNFDVHKQNRMLSEYLDTPAGEDEKNILDAEYVRNALEGLIFKDTDPRHCRMVIDHILQ